METNPTTSAITNNSLPTNNGQSLAETEKTISVAASCVGTFKARVCCGATLCSIELNDLATELFPLYARAFMHSDAAISERAEEFRTDLLNHLRDSERILIIEVGDYRSLICGRTFESKLGRIYHLGGILVDPNLQGKGLGAVLLIQELQTIQADILAFHTQSSAMLALGSKVAEINADLTAAVAPYLKHNRLEGRVDKQRYGGKPLYGDLQKSLVWRLHSARN